MSDDLDDLKAAMRAAMPTPDAARKADDIALAQKNFTALQESRDAARQTSERPKPGLIRGVMNMIMRMNTRGALTATTALVALGLVAVVPDWQTAPRLNGPQPVVLESDDVLTDRSEDRTRQVAEEQFATEAAPEVAAEPAPAEALESESAQDAESAIAPQALQPSETLKREQAPTDGQTLGGAVQGLVLQDSENSRALIAPAPSVDDVYIQSEANTEAFPDADPNPLKVTAEEPVSTFSIDVDTASYAVVRSSLMAGQVPPKDAVRIEEMVNYFPYDYAAPEGDAPFQPTVTVTGTPWNADTQLVHIAIQGENKSLTERPPLNLVFLIDTSGSMNAPAKLPLLKQSLALMLPELTERDSVAIVTYAGSAGQVLEPTPATDRTRILEALDRLDAGGSTAGQAGLQQAYAVAESMAEEGEVTRVLLATDGDFNVGLSDPEALKDFIADKRESGTYLSVLGFGRGNLDDATMQALAQNGNGQAAYIDTLSEAQKVLVDQLSGALYPIANDVKIQVEFNPAAVAEYRLIGYETRALAREDFNNDAVDAGDIGAGHQVTALYEITPVGSPARLTDPLRYGEAELASDASELGFLKLRYKRPGETQSELIEQPIVPGGQANAEMQFTAAIAGFGQLLRGNQYLGDWGYDDAIALANEARGVDAFGYRAEAVQLMRLAQSLQR
ncbi:vWA domain-containing protein [Roseovarius rhodophyticola]|uniref:VWA domain-containing protein n=1 Tax=Roseovarius rhodophyticola TaxID=3080827 RepID=A0ABZ2TJM5_9RHOB|nr:VWA domain-containing protein [Roseovarius sp. W115]MDV2930242.1 VWA domain-containing protein [Roseovarius sp. W115]